MNATFDAILATLAVILGISLVVQGIQQIFKQWLDLKSTYMKFQLLAMFDPNIASQNIRFPGLRRATDLMKSAQTEARTIVEGIERTLHNYGYRDLELLESISPDRLKQIIRSIDWNSLPGGNAVAGKIKGIEEDINQWFDLAKAGFQDLYQRKMKVWAFFLSFAIVVAMNADLFAVYGRFAADASLRSVAVAWAMRTTAQPIPAAAGNPADEAKAAAQIRARVDSVKALLESDVFRVVGWSSQSVPSERAPVLLWLSRIGGWLVMALLVSLGAPFWYDLLKTITGLKGKFGEAAKSASPQS